MIIFSKSITQLVIIYDGYKKNRKIINKQINKNMYIITIIRLVDIEENKYENIFLF